MRPHDASAVTRLWYRVRPLGRVLIGLGVVIVFLTLGAGWVEGSGCSPQLDLQFTGSGCAKEEGAFHASLWRDTLFALAYGVALTVAAKLLPGQRHRDGRLGTLDRLVLIGPLTAAAADGLENLALAKVTVHTARAIEIPGDWDQALVTALASVKWGLVIVVLGVLLLRLAKWRRHGRTV